MPLIIDGVLYEELTSDPVSPSEGETWYNTTDDALRVYRDGAVQEIVQVFGAPSDGNAPLWSASNNRWEPGTVASGDVDKDKVFYVGKHGNDANDGKTMNKAVLTFGQALTLAGAESPTSSNVWGIVCEDAGIYAESITMSSYVHLFAANACLDGSITLADDSSVEFEHLKCTSGTAVTMSSGTGTSYIQLKRLETDGANGFENSSTGHLNTEVEFYRQTGGVGLTGTSGIVHADIQDWDLYGASPTAVQNVNATVNLRTANLADRGATGTSVAFDCDGGTTNSLAVYVDTDTCHIVESGATLNLIVAYCPGVHVDNGGTINFTSAVINVTAGLVVADNAVVRGDGGGRGVQGSGWSIDDNDVLGSGVSHAGYILDVHNTKSDGGGNGFRIKAGELLGDIAFHVADTDDTFQIMEMEADQGYVTMGKTYAQTNTDNGVVYGLDNQHGSGTATDFNSQSGGYRVSGALVVENDADIAQVKNVRFASEHDNGNSGATPTVDWNNGNKQKITLSANATVTFTSLTDGVGNLLLRIVQDGTGSRTVTWPATVKWPGGTAPTLSTAASAIDIVSFYWDGTSYYGVASLDFQ